MLESFYRAHKAKAFPIDNPCPVSFEKIDKYLLILLPAYQFNLIMQKDKSSIADVLPSLEIMISKWSRMELAGEYKILVDNLIAAFRHKFSYEVKSDINAVATLLNISKLKIWYKRPDCLYIKKTACTKILEVQTIFDKTVQELPVSNANATNSLSSDSDDDSLAGFLEDDNYQVNDELNLEAKQMNLETEKIELIKLLDENKIDTTSTKKFWLKNKSKFPYLKKLAEILLNIPSSSAFIERYYSLCGIVCKQRCGNMTNKQIINRSLLKANIKIINEMNK